MKKLNLFTAVILTGVMGIIFFAPMLSAADKYHDPANMGDFSDSAQTPVITSPALFDVSSFDSDNGPKQEPKPNETPQERLERFIRHSTTIIKMTQIEIQKHQQATTEVVTMDGTLLGTFFALTKQIYVNKTLKEWWIPDARREHIAERASTLTVEMKILESTVSNAAQKHNNTVALLGILRKRISEFDAYGAALSGMNN